MTTEPPPATGPSMSPGSPVIAISVLLGCAALYGRRTGMGVRRSLETIETKPSVSAPSVTSSDGAR